MSPRDKLAGTRADFMWNCRDELLSSWGGSAVRWGPSRRPQQASAAERGPAPAAGPREAFGARVLVTTPVLWPPAEHSGWASHP